MSFTQMVAPTAGSEKQLLAYNLCDGETPQAEIGKKAKLDHGNLSRLISKWIETGIVVRVGATTMLPLHLYPATLSRAAEAPQENKSMSDDVSEKLDILIRLQAAALTESSLSPSRKKILFLSKAGLRPTLIAEIVGTTANHVNVTLSKGRKSSNRK